MAPKFSDLSSLVLVDTLAALPMESVVRMARLGHERLRQTCSLKWVTDRMTHVTFEEVLRAYQLKSDMAAIFYASSILKRLNGEVKIQRIHFRNADHFDNNVELAKQVIGRLHLHFEDVLFESDQPSDKREKFRSALGVLPSLVYASQAFTAGPAPGDLIQKCPEMVFDYYYHPGDRRSRFVYYRPALLNGRHVVDVLRVVCGPADVSEAELAHARREATERASDEGRWDEASKGIWFSLWRGAALTMKE